MDVSNSHMAPDSFICRLLAAAISLAALTVSLVFVNASVAATKDDLRVPRQLENVPISLDSSSTPEQTVNVCSSMDVRNHLVDVRELSSCVVIEGSLRVVVASQLIEQNITFPLLVQVTDYVMFYRVKGFRSFSAIFPNLAVIRGYRLFHEFALVVYENSQLETLGLFGLRRILRGNVRIEKNGRLCYLRTVDWQTITERSDAVILENKEPGLLESSSEAGRYQIDRMCTLQECPDRCMRFVRDDRRLKACWDHSHCQILQDRFECDPLCVGGCYQAMSASHCVACRYVQFNQQCYERCPTGTYLYAGWRCVSQQECLSFPTDRVADGDELGDNDTDTAQTRYQYHIAFNGLCLTQCPSGYTPTDGHRSCQLCKDECLKSCRVRRITSATQVQMLKGCSIIDGPLHIQVSGENIVAELEENLSSIRVIRDYLRVTHSEPLISLHFLRNLQKIEGRNLISDRYSLYFLHNHNLQTLWPNATQLTVENGLPFFHFNHKLCLDKIMATVARLGMATGDVVDIGPMTNGDKVPCRRETLHASVPVINATAVVISWQRFAVNDYRNLLGYNLFYRQTDTRNLTLYDDRSACSRDVWQVVDLTATNKTEDHLFEVVQGLTPYTQYAYYLETLMVNIGANATTAQSPIQYFTTRPTNPTRPRKLRVFALSDSQLKVQWSPPLHANGNVTHYRVVAVLSPLLQYSDLTGINVCSRKQGVFKAGDSTSKPPTTTTVASTVTTVGNSSSVLLTTTAGPDKYGEQCCACDKSGSSSDGGGGGGLRNIKQEQILFEDMMQNTLFVKKSDRPPFVNVRVTRNVPDVLTSNPAMNVITVGGGDDGGEDWQTSDLPPEPPLPPCSQNSSTQQRCVAAMRVYNTTRQELNSVVLSGLDYFREYTVEVIACQTPAASDSASSGDSRPLEYVGLCSLKAIASHQTLPRERADMLMAQPTVTNASANGSVLISWMDPPAPNGHFVLHYIVHTHRVNGDSSELSSSKLVCPLRQCLQLPCRRVKRMTLPAGNISVRIQAKTLAGYGPMSQPVYYLSSPVSSGLSVGEIVLIFIALLLVAGIMFVALLIYRRHFVQKNPLYSSSNPYYGNEDMTPYVPDEWEVEPERVCFERMLAQGSFGTVYVGTALIDCASSNHIADDGTTVSTTLSSKQTESTKTERLQRVAIKTLHATAHLSDRHSFLSEASIMKQYNCRHVVRLLGIVSTTRSGARFLTESSLPVPDPPYVIMELMTAGDLRSYLRMKRPDAFDDSILPDQFIPVMPEVYLMALQIADGMAYLSSVNSVHRDLAARNCMVTANDTGGVVVKIGDFGMTRDLYEKDYYKKGDKGLLPVRWMGPESLRDGVFTSQSDVWSYGVVLWEMATYAAQPYQGLTNKQVMTHVLAGHRLSRPVGCPQLLYDLMTSCWQFKPAERPTFIALIEQLLHCADGTFSSTSFYHSDRKKAGSDASAHSGRRAGSSTEPVSRASTEPSSHAHVLQPLMARSESLSSEEKVTSTGGGVGGEVVREDDASVEMSALLPPSVSYRHVGGRNGPVTENDQDTAGNTSQSMEEEESSIDHRQTADSADI